MDIGFIIFCIFGLLSLFLLFVLPIVGACIVIPKEVSKWKANKLAPQLTVSAKVMTKRPHVGYNYNTNTSAIVGYYVTFQMDDDSRKEFSVNEKEYGLLVEGDQGYLTYQGTWYVSFKRTSY